MIVTKAHHSILTPVSLFRMTALDFQSLEVSVVRPNLYPGAMTDWTSIDKTVSGEDHRYS
jgi:hypothetical protein